MDRAHRIGQKRVVNVYRLITKGTLEEKIMRHVCVCVRERVCVLFVFVGKEEISVGGLATGHFSGNDCMTVPVGVEFKG